MTIGQRLDLEREDRDHESPVARLGGRGKFAGCRQCMSNTGMRSVCRENIARMDAYDVGRNRWYCETGNSKYVFYPCETCNWGKMIPDGFVLMSTDEVLDWRAIDPMAPDYAALAAEPEQVLASLIDRESAGI